MYQWLIAAGSRLPLIGAIHSWSIDPRGPGRRLAYKRRQHAPLPALPMPGAGCCEQYNTTASVSQHENFQFSVNLKTFSGQRRCSSFELWAWSSIRKCHPKWDRLIIVNHQSTIMTIIFTILLIQTYIQINTGLNLLHGAKFQRLPSGKSVFLNSKFQIREFHAHWMEWGEVFER